MRLLEFQGKRLLAARGIRVPGGALLTAPEGVRGLTFPRVLKAQVPVGGRGRAGAVLRVSDAASAEAACRDIFSLAVKGWPVRAVLAEEPAPEGREMYLSLLVDGRNGLPLFMACPEGGVAIEETAKRTPERVLRHSLDPFLGVCDHDVRAVAKHLHLDARILGPVLRGLYGLFREGDATLAEINPLLATETGLLALDAKVVLDARAAFRHGGEFERMADEAACLDGRVRTPAERMAETAGITYVLLPGNVGLISDGAGTGMLTLDLIAAEGASAANFCEMGGLSNAATMREAMRVVLADERVSVLVVSLIGGLTRMDEMAEGIVAHLSDRTARRVPTVVRMCGTRAEAGIPLLQKAGVPVHEDLVSAVREAVSLAKRS